MIRSIFLGTLFMVCAFLTRAQPNVTIGKPYPVVDAGSKYYFTKNGIILTLKIEKNAVILQTLNASKLTFIKTRVYDDFPKNYVVEQVSEFKGHYYLFYSYYDNDIEQLFAREIDMQNCTFTGVGKKIISVEKKIAGSLTRTGFFSMGISDKFDFYFSYDSTSMVVQYRYAPEKKSDAKNYDIIGMHVFDKQLNEKWGKDVTMPYTEKKMDNLDYSVDSKGNVYIVTRVFNDDTRDAKKRGEEEANYKIGILKLATGTATISTTKVDVADKFIKTIWLYESAKGYMVCAGYYNNGKMSSGTDGVIMFKLNAEGKMFDMNTYEIPVSILNQYASDKTVRKNSKKEEDDEAEAKNLRLRDVLIQKDGSIILVGETYYIITHRSYSSTGGGTIYYTYHYEDVLVTKIDASNKLAYMVKLPKRQRGTNGIGGMSYRLFSGGGNLYFLFLDNIKNLDLPKTEVPDLHVDGQGGYLMCYTMNEKTGDVKKTSLLDSRDVNGMEIYQFSPSRMMATAPSTVVFEVYKKKKEDVLIKVVLPK